VQNLFLFSVHSCFLDLLLLSYRHRRSQSSIDQFVNIWKKVFISLKLNSEGLTGKRELRIQLISRMKGQYAPPLEIKTPSPHVIIFSEIFQPIYQSIKSVYLTTRVCPSERIQSIVPMHYKNDTKINKHNNN